MQGTLRLSLRRALTSGGFGTVATAEVDFSEVSSVLDAANGPDAHMIVPLALGTDKVGFAGSVLLRLVRARARFPLLTMHVVLKRTWRAQRSLNTVVLPALITTRPAVEEVRRVAAAVYSCWAQMLTPVLMQLPHFAGGARDACCAARAGHATRATGALAIAASVAAATAACAGRTRASRGCCCCCART